MFKLFKKIKGDVKEIKGMMDESSRIAKELTEDMKRDRKQFEERYLKLAVQNAWIRGKAGMPLSEKYAFDNERSEYDEEGNV